MKNTVIPVAAAVVLGSVARHISPSLSIAILAAIVFAMALDQ